MAITKTKTEKELDQKSVWDNRDVDIEHVGTKITLPAEPDPMPLRDAIKALERKAKDEETILNVFEIIDAYPEDALVALNAAMREKYGWASPTPKMSFFGPIPPQLITVQTGPKAGQAIQVPFGQFTLPGVENPVETHRHRTHEGMALVITGQVRKREATIVKELAELARKILKTSSIYKGKAIRLKVDEDGDLDYDTPPEFIETDNIYPNELVLNKEELEQVQSALWAPIEHTEECVNHGIPLNRGILLEGIYGTGKTLTAAVTSKVCVDNGWTYILLDDVRSLKDALLFAQRYAPALVFAEDVDRVVSERDQRGNDLLNTIDGVLTKNSQVITVLTTNHVEALDKAMLRPGRLDAVISIKAPDPDAVERLLRLYGRDLIAKNEPLKEVSKYLQGNIPATIREVVERSKLAMVSNGRSKVTEEDLLIAARGMSYHLELLKGEAPEPSLEHRAGAALGDLIAKKSGADTSELESALERAAHQIRGAAGATISKVDELAEVATIGSEKLGRSLKDIEKKVDVVDMKTDDIHEATVG